MANFDGDGRTDLCVAQSGAGTRLFRNATGRPGPRRELHAGFGHWSCDSAIVVLPGAGAGDELEVHWPDGRVTRHPVAVGMRELVLGPP